MSNWNDKANVIMRTNYESGKTFNTVPQVIDAGGKLPPRWRDETGRIVKRGKRNTEIIKRKPKKRERRTWSDGELETVLKMRKKNITWKEIAAYYRMHESTLVSKVRRLKKALRDEEE
ncbi:hypothetical protein JR334_01945 [Clostridia bacterium]|nr:hypothetical protein JR334_01945 [Clostridia bacterium]